MIIMSGRLGRDCEVREGVSEKNRPYTVLNNCVFVNNKELGDVPMNITAWGENAKFIQENFQKGDSIQLVAQETPHDRKVGDKEFTECVFTVRKILDWDMYINTVKFLGNTLSRLENSFTERTQDAENESQGNKNSDMSSTDADESYYAESEEEAI
jgi:hypothetical protein